MDSEYPANRPGQVRPQMAAVTTDYMFTVCFYSLSLFLSLSFSLLSLPFFHSFLFPLLSCHIFLAPVSLFLSLSLTFFLISSPFKSNVEQFILSLLTFSLSAVQYPIRISRDVGQRGHTEPLSLPSPTFHWSFCLASLSLSLTHTHSINLSQSFISYLISLLSLPPQILSTMTVSAPVQATDWETFAMERNSPLCFAPLGALSLSLLFQALSLLLSFTLSLSLLSCTL